MADPVDLEVDPGPEVVMNFEPVPRGPVLTAQGTLQRAYINWFNGQDRMLGEIVSGVNRYRQTIVNLATATEGELDTLTASVESVAEIATDAETAVATLTTEIVAARQGETSLSARITEVDQARVDGDSANASSISTVSAEVAAARQGQSNLSARITQVDQARVSGDSANATSISNLSATVGDVSASVDQQAGAIATLEGGTAWLEQIVSAGGGNLAAFRLRAGKEGSFIELISTVLRLANITNGEVIEIMRAISGEAFFSRPISADGSGRRVTIGPGYGVSGSQVVLWFGPDTIAPSSQSRTNGYFSLGTDGKVYYGDAELLGTSKWTSSIGSTGSGTAAPGVTANVTLTCSNSNNVGTVSFLYTLETNFSGVSGSNNGRSSSITYSKVIGASDNIITTGTLRVIDAGTGETRFLPFSINWKDINET